MILNNYWNMLATLSTTVYNASTYSGVNCVVNTSGTLVPLLTGGNLTACKNWAFMTDLSFVLGDSATDPTAFDYTIGNSVMSGISNVSITTSTAGSGNTLRTVITITGYNSSGADLTIREIGILKKASIFSQPSSFNYQDILLVHEKLNTPKTYAPNESIILTYEWVQA